MLVANATVARTYCAKKIPFVYRVHASPPEEKQLALRELTGALGISLPEKLTPTAIADMLSRVEPDKSEMVSMVTLRSMAKAEYKPSNDGHFGLNFPDYCHFTSPIRRYPDLAIHRIIKLFLRGGKQPTEALREWVTDVSARSSVRERVAEEAERKVDDLLKAKFMESKIGLIFNGIISGVTEWSLFVKLPSGIEGCIRVERLRGGLYELDAKTFTLSNGKYSYRLGDKARIEVIDVEGDFAFVSDNE